MKQQHTDDGARRSGEDAHLVDYWHVVLRRKKLVLAVVFGVTALAALRAFLIRPEYEGVAQILIERENPNILNFKEVTQVDAGQDDYYQTQYKLLQSRALVRKTIEEARLLAHPEFGGPRSESELSAIHQTPPGASAEMERAIDEFLLHYEVRPHRNSRIVAVVFESYRPELAAQVANKLSQLYIQQTLEFRYQTSAEAAQWLGAQIEDQRKKVEQADAALQLLKEKEGIVNIEERRDLLQQKLKELGTALTTLKTQRLQKEALYRQMREARNPEDLPEVMKNPVIENLRIELAKLERQQAQLSERYMDQHPELLRVRRQIEETRGKISGEAQRVIGAAENDYRAVAAQEASVASAVEAAKAEALELSRRGVQYDSLKRELEAGKEVLNSLLARHKQTDVAQELKASNIRIVDPAAIPREPIRPKRVRDVLLGLLLGLGFGVGLAFFIEYLDSTLKTPDDVRLHLGVPLLSVVPETSQTEDGRRLPSLLLAGGQHQGAFSESYRLLRTALSYSWPHQKPRVVLVTSTVPGEGKSLTSMNLAFTLASMHSRVLLVDADLRKPQAHTALELKRSPGLSDLLVGHVSLAEAVQQMSSSALSVMASGNHAPSPADLLTSDAVRGILESLRSAYDWVILDTSPVAAVSDPLILAALADGVVVIAGAEMVPRKAVLQTLDRIGETGARVLGVVLNRAQVEKHAYYYSHYYGHYKGYYGEPDPTDPPVAAAAKPIAPGDNVAAFKAREAGRRS